MADISVSGVTIDSTEPDKLAAWWAEALGWHLEGRSCRSPGGGLQPLEEDFPPELGYHNVVLRDPEGNEFCVGGPPGAESGSPCGQ